MLVYAWESKSPRDAKMSREYVYDLKNCVRLGLFPCFHVSILKLCCSCVSAAWSGKVAVFSAIGTCVFGVLGVTKSADRERFFQG
jgi:hypothetical protein